MEKKIKAYIAELEKKKNVKVLLACETGSRAWGFPSPDSDFDVRILYVHKTDWYLTLNDQKDSIEVMLENNDLDITGWELKKSLKLLYKSNVALLERIQSPIIYTCDKEFLEEVNLLAEKCYSKIATMHHYLSMAKKCMSEINRKEEYKLKKLFYTLRTTIACKWIIDRNEIPPIEFSIMLDKLEIDNKIVDRINELIKFKLSAAESYMHKGELELISYMNSIMEEATEKAKGLSSSKNSFEAGSDLLRKYILKNDNRIFKEKQFSNS